MANPQALQSHAIRLIQPLVTAMFCSQKWGLPANLGSPCHQTLKPVVGQAWVVLSSCVETVNGQVHLASTNTLEKRSGCCPICC